MFSVDNALNSMLVCPMDLEDLEEEELSDIATSTILPLDTSAIVTVPTERIDVEEVLVEVQHDDYGDSSTSTTNEEVADEGSIEQEASRSDQITFGVAPDNAPAQVRRCPLKRMRKFFRRVFRAVFRRQ